MEEKRTPFLHARRRARRGRRVSALSQKIKEIELERGRREKEGSKEGGREGVSIPLDKQRGHSRFD